VSDLNGVPRIPLASHIQLNREPRMLEWRFSPWLSSGVLRLIGREDRGGREST
jgi:hypothetical protein